MGEEERDELIARVGPVEVRGQRRQAGGEPGQFAQFHSAAAEFRAAVLATREARAIRRAMDWILRRLGG